MQKRTKIDLRCHTKMSSGTDYNEIRMAPGELVKYACENGYKAIAVTDRGSVQAFPEVYRTWKKMWDEFQEECEEHKDEAQKENFLKVIYGLEGNIMSEDGQVSLMILYAKDDKGIQNLYRLVTASYLEGYDKKPIIPWKSYEECREGLICISPDELDEMTAEISEQTGYLSPIREGKFYPNYPEADVKLGQICKEKLREIYGSEIPKEARERFEKELSAICRNGYASIYMLWRDIAKKSKDLGYPFTTRGSVASSFVALLCGITEINPLSAECGGYDIPVETFLGINLDKEPDIDLNFAYEIQELLHNYVGELPGVGDTCYGGTVGTLTEKMSRMHVEEYYYHNNLPLPDESILKEQTKTLCGVKRCDGRHPGGIIVAPEGEELVSFTPLQHPWNSDRITTHFDYHALTDSLLKMDILGYEPADRIHKLQELTGIAGDTIPLNDKKVLDMLCDPDTPEIIDLPEFGSEYARRMIKISCPESYDDLIKVCALMHGTEVWCENQDVLIAKKIITLSECIASRDDIFLALVDRGMTRENAYNIMNSVRRGKGLTENMEHEINQIGMPEWFTGVCKKIKYMFPKAHAVSSTLFAWRLAYYMTYYPEEYKEALSAAN